jgi:hypothetical protein
MMGLSFRQADRSHRAETAAMIKYENFEKKFVDGKTACRDYSRTGWR